MRLKFFCVKRFKFGRFKERFAYISKNSGKLYWIYGMPNPTRSKNPFYTWQDWILYAESEKLGQFQTLMDAQLEAQRKCDG